MELMKEIHGGNVWIPYSSESSSWKGFQARFLLVNGYKRCRADCQDLQSLLVRSQAPAKAWGSIAAHHSQLAVTTLGNGHRWTTANGPRHFKFAMVAIEYFTKWIEARPLSTITSFTIRKFFWQQIICRFGVPKELTIDNGKQFDCQDLKEYCHSIGTKLCFASVYHPQSNGVVERANGQIF
jgi:hypothetical protein